MNDSDSDSDTTDSEDEILNMPKVIILYTSQGLEHINWGLTWLSLIDMNNCLYFYSIHLLYNKIEQ